MSKLSHCPEDQCGSKLLSIFLSVWPRPLDHSFSLSRTDLVVDMNPSQSARSLFLSLMGHSSRSNMIVAEKDNDCASPAPPAAKKRFRLTRIRSKKGLSMSATTAETDIMSPSEDTFGLSTCFIASSSLVSRPDSPPLVAPTEVFEAPPKNDCYQIKKNKRPELGYLKIDHARLEDAVTQASGEDKPIIFIQTATPGDADAGRECFSHPLIVEAIGSLFVPVHRVGIAESRCARGRRCCRVVIDFLDPEGNELEVPRICSQLLNPASLVQGLVGALAASRKPIPKYLALLKEEESGRVGKCGVRKADSRLVLGVSDVATAEVALAEVDGVLATQAGSVGAQRVVEVCYDFGRVSFGVLLQHALERNVPDAIFYTTNDERVAAQMEVGRSTKRCALFHFDGEIQPIFDPKAALRKTPLRFVPLTALQATRANLLVDEGRFNEAVHLLSPNQGRILMLAMQSSAQKSLHEVVDVAILPAWISVCEKEHPKRTSERLDAEYEKELTTQEEYM